MQTSAFAVGYNNTQNKKHGFIKDFCPIILKCLRLALTLQAKQQILHQTTLYMEEKNYKRENGERLILIWVAH